MSISASISFFFNEDVAQNEELMEKVIEIIEGIVPFIEGEYDNGTGKTIYVGDVHYDYHEEILEALKEAKIEAECIVRDCSDNTVEDFTTTLKNVGGEMVIRTMTKSGERVVEELEKCLEQITNGATIEELTAFIQDKINKESY